MEEVPTCTRMVVPPWPSIYLFRLDLDEHCRRREHSESFSWLSVGYWTCRLFKVDGIDRTILMSIRTPQKVNVSEKTAARSSEGEKRVPARPV